MANSWMKLYHETLNDPKMGTMSDHLYRRTIELFLLAGQEDRNGLLPPLTQIAWALRTTVNDATLCLQELSELGIITKNQDGTFMVTNFSKRQDSNLSNSERVARSREKAKREERYSTNAYDVSSVNTDVTQDVTKMKREERYNCNAENVSNANAENVTNVTIDKDKDKEEDKDKELINKAAEAAVRGKPAKQKLSPDQPEFWNRAFGPEADRARAFAHASGINPIGTEFGRWQKDLRAFTEAGISTEQMIRAVEKVRKDGKYPIKAPGTVFTEARNLAAANPAGKLFADIAAEYEQQAQPDPLWDIDL